MSEAVTVAKPRRLSEKNEIVTLDDAIEYDGRIYDQITVTKLSISAFREHLDKGERTDQLSLPMFKDAEGNPVPIEVMDELTVGDAGKLNEVASNFLRRKSAVDQESSSGR